MLICVDGVSFGWNSLSKAEWQILHNKGSGGIWPWARVVHYLNLLCDLGKVSSLLWISVFPYVKWERNSRKHPPGVSWDFMSQSRGLWCIHLERGTIDKTLDEADFVSLSLACPALWNALPFFWPIPTSVLVFICQRMVVITLTLCGAARFR